MNSHETEPAESTPRESAYAQDTEIDFLRFLAPALISKTFIDVGAEKGEFARTFMAEGFDGAIFEPLPMHTEPLHALVAGTRSKVFAYAVDSHDHRATFHIACDANGEPLNYFHSLTKIAAHPFFSHAKEIPVECRSLGGMLERGEIDAAVGILKIDTEGNDLKVLQGLGKLRPEVIVCEFVPPSLYKEWAFSFADALIAEARQLGYPHVVAFKRRYRCQGESVVLNPAAFHEDDWGNLVFLSDGLFEKVQGDLLKRLEAYRRRCHFDEAVPVLFSPHYGESFSLWLEAQIRGFARLDESPLLLDVGAFHGEFSETLLQKKLFARAILFEPNPRNAKVIREKGGGLAGCTVEQFAVGSEEGTVHFYCDAQPATGSVLPYTSPSKEEVRTETVQRIRLDAFLGERGLLDQIGLLKIDTQGHDLEVLKGAEKTLAASTPIVVAEMIFDDLYQGQAAPHEIIQWMAGHGYRLAGIFDEHYSAQGWLAWCDACFVPMARAGRYREPFQIRTSPPVSEAESEALAARIRQLEEEIATLKSRETALTASEAALRGSNEKLQAQKQTLRAELDGLKQPPLRRLLRRLRSRWKRGNADIGS